MLEDEFKGRCPPNALFYDQVRGELICTETGEVLADHLPDYEIGLVDANEKTRYYRKNNMPFNTTGGPIRNGKKRKIRDRIRFMIKYGKDGRRAEIILEGRYSPHYIIIESKVPLPKIRAKDVYLPKNARRYENTALYYILGEMLRRYGYTNLLHKITVTKNGKKLSTQAVLKQAYRWIRKYGVRKVGA